MDTKETTIPTVDKVKTLPFNDIPPKSPVIDEGDKEAFYKCFLSDQPYAEEVKLFNGRFKMKLRSLLTEEGADIIKQVSYDQDKGVAQNNDAYFIRVAAYRLGLSLLTLNGVPFEPDINSKNTPDKKDEGISYVLLRAQSLLAWPQFKLASVIDRHREFESKVFELTKAVQDDSFWKAAV